jgi:hypothetical protein
MGNKIGVNIPLTSQGFDTAEEVLQLHIDKNLSTEKSVYFSTSSRINFKKARELDLILLSNRAGLRYLAEIEEYHHFDVAGIPVDSAEYSPAKYADVPENHWFKLSSIRKASTVEVENLIPLNKKMITEYQNVENYICNTNRLQTFYFKQM